MQQTRIFYTKKIPVTFAVAGIKKSSYNFICFGYYSPYSITSVCAALFHQESGTDGAK